MDEKENTPKAVFKSYESPDLLRYRADRAATKQNNEEKYRANCKKALKEHATTKLKTTMIGSLSKFESNFGFLWGHGKPVDELTEQELDFKEKWDATRNEVLNQGNNCLRSLMTEIDGYTVSFNKFEYNFTVKKESQDDNRS